MRLGRFPSALTGRPLRLRRSGSAKLRLAIRAVMIVAIVLVVAVVGAVTFVLVRPTEVGFVRDRITATLQSNLGPDYTVAIDRAVIDIDPVLGLVVRVDDVDVRDSLDAVVAHVPSTRFTVNPLRLLSFRIEVSQVELSGAELSFVRAPDGAVLLGNAGTVHAGRDGSAPAPAEIPTAVSGGFPDLVAALTIMDRGIEPPIDAAIDAGFERFAMVSGTINVWDATLNQQRRFTSTDVSIRVDRATRALVADFATSGYGGRWTATINREFEASTGGHVLSVQFSQLTVADVLPALAARGGPLSADIPLYGRANVRFDGTGAIQSAEARLDLGAGILTIGGGRETILLDEATVRLRWDVANRALIVDPSTFFFGDTRGVVTGRVIPDGDPAERRYAYELESLGAILAPSDSGEPPLIAQRIAVNGIADFKRRLLSVENLGIVAGGASIAAAGSLGFEGKTPSLAAAAAFSPMSAGTLKQMWVPFIAPIARRWVMEHLSEGRLVSGHFEAAVPSGVLWTRTPTRLPDDAMRLDLRVEDATFSTFGELPPITNAAGVVVLSGSTFGVDLDRGEVHVPSGTVTVEAGAFAVPNVAKRPNDGIVEMELAGSARALAEIADSKPLLALQRANLSPSDLSGAGTATISVRLPLRDALTEADVDWKVVVNTDGVSSQTPIQGRRITDANVALTATPQTIAVYGRAKVDGVDADVSMSFPLGSPGTQQADESQVRLVLDAEARERMGVGLRQVLSGTLGALVTDIPGGQHYELDLRRARVVLPGVGWAKGIGVAATLSCDVKASSEGYTVENLEFTGDGFGFTGSAMLDKSYGLLSADITRLSLHKGDSIAIKMTRGPSGYGISARGTSFDLRGFLSQARDEVEQSGGFPDLAIDARVDTIVGFNQETIADARLNLVSVGGETQRLLFSGSLAGTPISLNYAVTPQGTTLDGSAADAGRLLRFTNYYTRMAGGSVALSGQAGPNGPMLGTAEMVDFDVVNEPAIAEVASGARSQPGFTGSGANPRHVHFDRMVARFRKSEWTLAIEDALLRGPSVGATFAGRYDLPTTNVTLTGTYLPAYPVNNLFGRIPLIGLALGAGAREGLIGVTFKIEGPIAEPQVFVNPLSAVAPGIFRKIFEFQ